MPTFALLVSAGLTAIAASPAPHGPAGAAPPTAHFFPTGCATDAGAQWALWFVSKWFGGVKVMNTEWKGVFEDLRDRVGKPPYSTSTVPADVEALKRALGKVASIANVAAAVLTALTTFVAIAVMRADVKLRGDTPLQRTPSTEEDGESRGLDITVSSDYGQLPENLIEGINCVLTLLAVLSNNSTLPVPGPLAGVEVTVKEGRGVAPPGARKGFFVMITGARIQPADPAGVVTLVATGLKQEEKLAEDAPELDRRFSLIVSSTVDPQDRNTMVKYMLDAFLCEVAIVDPFACADSISDALKSMTWSLGEHFLAARDWERERPLFVVDAYKETTRAQMRGAAGGVNTATTELVDRQPPPLSTMRRRCDPSDLCPLDLNFWATTTRSSSWYDTATDCSFAYEGRKSIPDPYEYGLVSIPLPPSPDSEPFSPVGGPVASEVTIGSALHCFMSVPSEVLPQVHPRSQVHPSVMLSGLPVTVEWKHKGKVPSGFRGGLIEWEWSQSVTFHRVNPDGTPYTR